MPQLHERFPDEYRPVLVELARIDQDLVSRGRLTSDVPCPYRSDPDLYGTAPSRPQKDLFADANEPVPVTLYCDYHGARMLALTLTQHAMCCRDHCPVRANLPK